MVKNFLEKIFSFLNLKIIKMENYNTLKKLPRSIYVYALLNEQEKNKVVNFLNSSKSQLAQDIFVISQTDKIDKNFFVEFGATDGVILSYWKKNWVGMEY